MVRSIEGAFSRLADAVRGERKPLNSLPTTYGTTSTAVASNAGITAAGQHASAEAGDSPPPLYHYSSYSIPVPLLQEKPNDMTPYVDQAPMTVLVNTPIEQVMALFAHLGINYVCVTYHGQYRGIIFKKRLIGYLSELDKAGMTH
ncbi:hypothetical protein EV182_006310 [Spiromyces aspiralis]|uniref:Uncharacterized protein n=1 Tax=Spiromyces aspiralis TaxID=68401 RepID=A0ACC1HCQ2_9FUNG|nr:hypothetical protein EV182_006310 [Spiromyces aspiralis]